MIKFRVGDKVKVTSGKDKGREGKIERIFPKKGTALIPEINMFKKHVKGREGVEAGIYDIPRPMPFSKFALICTKCKKQTRVGFKIIKGNKKRVCKKCGREFDSAKTKKK